MMDVFRRAAKGWTAKVLIGLLVLSFGVWGVADVFRGFRGGTLATIGSEEISTEQFSNSFRQALQNYSQQLGETVTPERARGLGLDRQILAEMLKGAAVISEARGLRLAVSDAQIAADIARNPNFTSSQGQFDPAFFKSYLQRNGVSESGYLASERDRLIKSAITDTVQSGLTMPNAALLAALQHDGEQRDARYFTIKASESDITAPTEDQIKKYYEEHPAKYTAPEYRSIAIVKAEPSDIADTVKLSEDDIRAGYDKYRADYFTPERRTLQQVTFSSKEDAERARNRVLAGEDLLAIAKERGFTEQDATWNDRTAADIPDPIVANAAFSLSEGEISQPVEGQLAVMLIKAVKVTPEHQQTLEEVRDSLTRRLKLENAGEALRSIYDMVEDARASQTAFEDIAKNSNLPFLLIPAVDALGKDLQGLDVSLPNKQEVLKRAFDSEVGIENDAFTTKDDGYIWYEVREVIPSKVKPLDAVREQVKADLNAQRTREVAIEKARKMVERASSGVSFDELAREVGAEVSTAEGLKRTETGQGLDAAAVAALFSVPEKAVTFAPEADGQGAKVIYAETVLKPAANPDSAASSQIRNSLTRSAGADMLGSYLASLQDQLGFTVNETLWRQITGAP